jgi:hypothetical protein
MPTCTWPDGGCGAPVIFVPSATTGRKMILDAKPEKRVVLVARGPMTTLEPYEPGAELVAKVIDTHLDHHSTCTAFELYQQRQRAGQGGSRMTEQVAPDLPRPEPEGDFRVPSQYPRCRRAHCHQQPVADMRRVRHVRRPWARPDTYDTWSAYCADHLREYNREIRNGQVWWLGYPEEGEG